MAANIVHHGRSIAGGVWWHLVGRGVAPRSARRVATTVSVTRFVCSAIREPGVRSRSLVTKRL